MKVQRPDQLEDRLTQADPQPSFKTAFCGWHFRVIAVKANAPLDITVPLGPSEMASATLFVSVEKDVAQHLCN